MISIVPATLALSLVLSCFGLALATANDTCYNKDGVQIDTAFACGSTAAASQCCYWGWICLSNGLCSPGPDAVNNGLTNYYRPDGCTDPTWSSENCFSGCNNFGGNGLTACDIGKFCCYDFEGCICTASSLFTLGTAQILTTIPLSTSTPKPSSTPASTTAATTTSNSVSTSASTSASTSLPAATSPEQASTTPTTPAAEPSSSNGAALGAGVGVGLGVPILVLTIILIILYRRSRKQGAYHAPQEAGRQNGYYAPQEEAQKYEMEAPNVIHEAGDSPYYSPAQKFAENARIPHEMDAGRQSRQFTPGWGWHR